MFEFYTFKLQMWIIFLLTYNIISNDKLCNVAKFRIPLCSVQFSFPEVDYIGRQRITIPVSTALYFSWSTQGNFESLSLHGPFQFSVRYYPSIYSSYLWRIWHGNHCSCKVKSFFFFHLNKQRAKYGVIFILSMNIYFIK